MGAVYRARDEQTGGTVALKLLQHGESPEMAERFAREARVLSELHHPGIVAYLAHGEAETGAPYLAMEWLEGEDLAQRLSRGPLPIAETLVLLRHAAEALAEAHARGLVHRDLKPSNLFLRGGQVERLALLDFGIARRSTASQAVTATGAVIGTPNYMAPEQARGGRNIAPSADVFSLGCVLYECLTGQPPFAAEHVAAVLARILFEEPPPLGKRRPGVPAPVSALLSRMLAKDPAQRLAGAGALLAELDAMGGLPELDAPGALLEGSSAPTLPLRPRPSPVFAEREQGLFSLVVASPPLPAGSDATVPDEEYGTDAERRSDLGSALSAMGLSPELIANGSLVVKVTGAGSATDQAALAARAALAVKERWPAANVALATGRGAVEGAFAVGEVADRAVRLLTAPQKGSGVRVDELSARLLGARFALTPSPEGAVLIGEEKDADMSRPLLGKPTPCVGREAELGSLEALFVGCVEESEARAVLVTAPPGAGKSRLRHELLRRIERRGEPVTILAGRGDAMSAGAPYGILAAAIRALVGVSSDAAPEEQRRLLRARVGQYVGEAERERVVRFVGELCDVPFPGEGLPMLQAARHEAKIMADCLRRAVLDWLTAECGAGPVLVVLDDLQWGDALTVSTLDGALREQVAAPLFALALARPEVHEAFPRLWHGHKMQEIALRGLGRKACERLIREVLGKDVPAAVLDRAVEQSTGNALFLEELIRTIAEEKGEEQPETVVAMLQARMGRLPAGPRRALQAASVFGQTFWAGGVAQVLAAAPADVTGWLSALIEAELVQPSPTSRLQGEKEYAFRHALVRDAAYGLLTASDIPTGHRSAGEFLEAACDGEAAVIAEHFERGGDPKRAATFFLRAAEEGLQRGDYTGARRVCDKGFACAPEGEVLGRLKSVVAYVGWLLNVHAGMGDAARTAMGLLRPGSLGWWRAIVGALSSNMNDPGHTFELLSLFANTDPDPKPDARAAHIEAQFYISPMLTQAAPEPMLRAHINRIALSVDSASETIPAVRRWLLISRSYASMWRYPRPWSTITDCGQCIRLAREVADQKIELVAKVWCETSWFELGDLDGARKRMEAMEATLAQGQEALTLGVWANHLLRILCEVPDEQAWGEADDLMAQALERTDSVPSISFLTRVSLGRLAFVRGRLERAEELSRAVTAALLPVVPGRWMMAAPVHVRALLGLGRAAEACSIAEQIVGVLTRLGGAGWVEVEARLAVSEAFEANGDHDRARTELAETLRQVQLRLDDIADPFWKNSYLTRNPYVALALALGRAWGLPALERTPG
jgi:hypothetical protein